MSGWLACGGNPFSRGCNIKSNQFDIFILHARAQANAKLQTRDEDTIFQTLCQTPTDRRSYTFSLFAHRGELTETVENNWHMARVACYRPPAPQPKPEHIVRFNFPQFAGARISEMGLRTCTSLCVRPPSVCVCVSAH